MKHLKLLVMLFLLTSTYGCKSTLESNLFNGKNLDGWEVFGTEKWYVEDGLLVAESGPNGEYGYLATTKSYKNFELTVDFLQEEDGNSGEQS